MRQKITAAALILFFVPALFLFAGDSAEFVNLGFSEDGRFFLFGQYGYQAEETRLYADLFMVDVTKNQFVPNGVHRGTYGTVLEPGQSADGGIFTLWNEAYPQIREHGIKPVRKGRPLYIRITDNSDGVNLDFRDFETGWHYVVSLNQTVLGDGGDVESSFYIDVKRDKSDIDSTAQVSSYEVGLPDFRRAGVTDYTIERILLAPNGKALVFVIAKTIHGAGGSPNIRYMVETLRL